MKIKNENVLLNKEVGNNSRLPRVLIICINPWDDTKSTNTLQNIFACWDPDKLACVYTRSGLPNSVICNNYFRISENKIIKSVFTRKKVGEIVFNKTKASQSSGLSLEERQETKLYKRAHKRKSWLMTLLRDCVWSLGKWKTKELDTFISNFDPDIIFFPIYPARYMSKIQLYISHHFNKPCVSYMWDDVYSYESCSKNPLEPFYRFLLRKRVKKLVSVSAKMFAIGSIQAKEISKTFNRNCLVLTKGIDFSNISFNSPVLNKPINVVYTGNLLIGRKKTLFKIIDILKKINQSSLRITFNIYTQTSLSKSEIARCSNGIIYHGEVSRTKMESIQRSADALLYVESLEKGHKKMARLSFSSKLTDYFAAGKCIIAVGSNIIAPIMYLKENDSAIVSTSYDEFEMNIFNILNDPELLQSYSKKSFECGLANHNKTKIDDSFKTELIKLLKEKK